jgi:RimJ/RimL family protein N-acetyltransferase
MADARAAGACTFRRLAEADLPRLHRWLNAPHVLEWWDRPGPTPEHVRKKYLPRTVPQDGFAAYVMQWDGSPIGYIQLYRVAQGAWNRRDIGSSAGIDLFIGEPAYLHRGLGPQILRRFLSEVVFRDAAVDACLIDPSPRNRIALRAFEKAGFRLLGAATDPESGLPVCLLRITRQEATEVGAD